MNYGYSYMSDGSVYITADDNKSRLEVYKNNLPDILQQENIIEYIDINLDSLNETLANLIDNNKNLNLDKNWFLETSGGSYALYYNSLINGNMRETLPSGVLMLLSMICAIKDYKFINDNKKEVKAINSKILFLNLNKEKEIEKLKQMHLDSKIVLLGEKVSKYFNVPTKKVEDFDSKYKVFSTWADNPKSFEKYYLNNNDIYQELSGEYSFNEEEVKILKNMVRSK